MSAVDSSVDKMEHKPYRQLVGSLLYLVSTMRPDITFSTSLLVGKRVPTGVGKQDDPEGDPVEATRLCW